MSDPARPDPPLIPGASLPETTSQDTREDAPADQGPAPTDLGRTADFRTPVPGRGLDTEQVERLENEDQNRPGDDNALSEGNPGDRPMTEASDPTEAELPGDPGSEVDDFRIEEGEARPGSDEL